MSGGERAHDPRCRDGAIACGACSLIVSLDDLGSGASSDASSDAAADAGLSDAGSSDAGSSDAGSSDAPFCKLAAHSFCDDFDELSLGALWTTTHVTTATLTLDDAATASPPYSLFANVSNAQGGEAYLEKDFTGGASHFYCQLDMRVDTLGSVPILSFQLGLSSTDPNRTGYTLTLLHTSAKSIFSEWTGSPDGGGSSATNDMPVIPVASGAWTHVVLDMNFGAGTLKVTYDGSPALVTTLSAPPNSGQAVWLGIVEPNATVAAAHFDDFACDITP